MIKFNGKVTMADPQEKNSSENPLAEIDPLIHAPARLMVLTYLYVVESIDFVYLKRVTGLSWGNLSTHLTKLDDAGYVIIKKTFQDKKPHTMIQLTDKGREAFREYKDDMQQVLGNLPD
jgi:DNA-binding MarR family transcriptional regulator